MFSKQDQGSKAPAVSLCEGLNGDYLDNTKHFSWLCNLKQLKFRHFNTNSKKFFETVNCFQKEAKTARNRPILFSLLYQGVFGHFTRILDYFKRSPKTAEDFRKLTKRSDHCRCVLLFGNSKR